MFFDIYKSLCEGIGKTPNGVAKELKFASSSVTQWKHGSTPRPDALQRIADYFGVSVGYLLTGEQKEKPSANGEGLSPEEKELYEILESASPDMIRAILDIAKIVQKEDVYRKMIILEMEADK